MQCMSKVPSGNKLVSCADLHGHEGLHHEFGDEVVATPRTELWWNGSGVRVSVSSGVCDSITVRRSIATMSLAAYAEHAESPRYYGTQPEVLPETLPATTCGAVTRTACGEVLLLFREGEQLYYGRRSTFGSRYARPEQIDWTTVLVQEAKTQQCECHGVNLARGECGKCGRAALVPSSSVTVINTQAEADALFGAGTLLAGVAGSAIEELTERKLCACSTAERPIAATHGYMCAYCHHWSTLSESDARDKTDKSSRQATARARNEAALAAEKAKPRPSRESRELAKPHPWLCSGEDEP